MRYKAEFSFILLYCLALVVSLFQTLNQEYFPGELHRYIRTISDFETIAITIFNLVLFIICFTIYILLDKKKIKISHIEIVINYRRLDFIILILLLAQIAFLLTTGVGRVTLGEPATSKYSALFAFIKPEPFVFLYYLLNRTIDEYSFRKKKLFTINVALFIIWKLTQGWSSFILLLFFLELFVFIKKKASTIGRAKVNLLVLLIPIFVIVIGGSLYSYVYTFKNEIRGNSLEPISLYKGIEELASRLSMNSNSLGAYQNYYETIELYRAEEIVLKESQAFLRPIVPGSLINKDFRNLNNNVMTSYTPTLNQYTSSDFGILMYTLILAKANIYDMLMSMITGILLIFIAKIFFDNIEVYHGQLSFLLFYLIFKTFYTVSLENVFGQGFVPYIYVFILCVIFGAFKVRKRCN